MRRKRAAHSPSAEELPPGTNPYRDEFLFWLTREGYIIAEDITCQHEYVQAMACPHCGGELTVVALLNRAGQGLSEVVSLCHDCRARTNVIFDISNDVYQAWWAAQLGDMYVQQYDGPPRVPVQPR
jgi:hypothetical protein